LWRILVWSDRSHEDFHNNMMIDSRRIFPDPPASRWLLSLLAACALASAALGQTERVQPAFDFSAALASAESMPRLHSLLVSWNGELVIERYFNGHDANDVANIKSVSKSVISALIGIAIEKGFIEGIDQPIGDFFEASLVGEPEKQAITIGNLLSMQAGLETTSNRNYGAWVLSGNWVEWALARDFEDKPGGRMIYSTGNSHLLSAILSSSTGMTTLEFARKFFGEPLGLQIRPWPSDPQGIYFGGNDMELTPREMLAIGELYLEGGEADGRRVLSEDWIEASFVPRTESEREPERYYGYGWWVRDMVGFETPYAWGYGGQFILLVPRLDLVVVTTSSSHPGPDRRRHTRRIYDYAEFEVIAPAARALGHHVRRGLQPIRDDTVN
jgi:CubicO group peptidase (beta-lactamase class C family)